MKQKKIKFSLALFLILISTFIFSGFNYFIYVQIKKRGKLRLVDPKYNIEIISQEDRKNSLDVNYLAELIGLSKEKKINIYAFDEKSATRMLLKSPIIKTANVIKIKPNNIFIDYSMRDPIAELYDFENVAIDAEGYLFPLKPYFKDKKLPSLYLSLERFEGFIKINDKRAALAMDILKKLKTSGFCDLIKIKSIDTSRILFKSYGKREIIISIKEDLKIEKNNKVTVVSFPIILRLGLNNYQKQISNYLSLREQILKDYERQLAEMEKLPSNINFDTKVIDLRISKLAFIDQ